MVVISRGLEVFDGIDAGCDCPLFDVPVSGTLVEM
jgi:hypothetical protein